MKRNILNENEPIPIVALTKEGKFVGEYVNHKDCEFKLNISNVSAFFAGKIHHVGGYIFVKKENYDKDLILTYDSIVRKRKFLKKYKK